MLCRELYFYSQEPGLLFTELCRPRAQLELSKFRRNTICRRRDLQGSGRSQSRSRVILVAHTDTQTHTHRSWLDYNTQTPRRHVINFRERMRGAVGRRRRRFRPDIMQPVKGSSPASVPPPPPPSSMLDLIPGLIDSRGYSRCCRRQTVCSPVPSRHRHRDGVA